MANNQFEGVGIISFLLDIIGYFIGCGSEKRERNKSKKRTYNPQTGTYIDQYGATRLYSDNSYVQINRNEFDEIVVRYQNGKVRNLDQEKYDKAPGTVTRLTGYSNHERAQYFKSAIGYRYRDRKTNEIYVIRFLEYENNYYLFYMNVSNGLIVRPTDGQLKMESEAKKRNLEYYTKEDFDKMIKYFNDNINNFDTSFFFRNKNNSTDYSEENIKRNLKHRRKKYE